MSVTFHQKVLGTTSRLNVKSTTSDDLNINLHLVNVIHVFPEIPAAGTHTQKMMY